MMIDQFTKLEHMPEMPNSANYPNNFNNSFHSCTQSTPPLSLLIYVNDLKEYVLYRVTHKGL